MDKTTKIEFEVTCFNRSITFTLSPDVAKAAMEILNKSYEDWLEDDKGWCCEEYLCHCLTEAGIKYSYECSEAEENEEE